MKKLFTLLLACLLISALAVSASAASMGYTYSAPYGTPTVDGVVDDVWNLAGWGDIEMRMNDSAGEHAKFKILHDDEYLYFLLQWNDTTVTGNENVKVYIHEHAGVCAEGEACPDYTRHQFVVNDSYWCHVDPHSEKDPEDPGDALPPILPGELKNTVEGESCTMEFSMKLHKGVSAIDTIRLELVFEDYNPDWQGPHAWNTVEGNGNLHADHGTVYLLPDDGAEIPAVTDPVETEAPETEAPETEAPETEVPATEAPETEPAETEPKETEKADEPKDTAKDEAPATTAADAEEPVEKGGFPVVPVAIAAVVVIAVILAIVFAKKKKK